MATPAPGAVQLYTAQDEGKVIQRVFSANLEALKKSAPRFLGDPGRLIRIAYNSIVYDDKLRRCTQASLMGGVMEALKLGITLGGPMQEGWLIPFHDNKTNRDVATLIVGYQGYRNIIDRARSVLDLHPRLVFAGDEFDVQFGTEPKIRHKPWYTIPGTAQGPMTHAYAVARLRGGGVQFEVLTKDDIDAHRKRSRASSSGPWVTDYNAMAMKTAIRVVSKYVPKSSEILARALDLDDRADRGVDQEFDIEGLTVFDEPKAITPGTQGGVPTALDQLKTNLAGGAPPPPELRPDPPAKDENAAIDAEIAAKENR
jgi:recombination protein RecT